VVQSIINFVRLSYSGSPRLQCRYVIKALPQSILPRPYFYFLTMKSSFASRRQLRRVGQDDEDETSSDARPGLEREEQGTPSHFLIAAQISDKSTPTPRLTASSDQAPTVTLPSIGSRNGTSKIKKRSSLRMSFGPGGTSMIEDDGNNTPAVFTSKKSNFSRQAAEKNALRKTLAANLSAEQLPLRRTDDRPSYSKDYLNELKGSTPSTPKDLRSQSDIAESRGTSAIDLATKFGSDLIVQDSRSSAIPTDAEIREKKERRARLAKEQDVVSFDDDDDSAAEREEGEDDSNDERSLLPYARQKANTKEDTRLVRDDEDIAEGFDNFVSDGRIALGKKAEREQKKRHEAEIRDLINEAEGGGSEDSEEDDSEVERNAAYEAAQTRKGMDGLHRDDDERVKPRRPRTPPRITPMPTLSGCLERLKGQLAAKQYSLGVKEKRLQEIKKEREDITTRQEELQRLLKETGERYEKLRAEAGADEPSTMDRVGNGALVGAEGMARRGLENLGEA